MRAAGKALKGTAARLGTWALGIAIVGIAGSALSLAPKRTALEPGAVVSYSEDRLGRPWRIVRRIGYETFEIRNGRVLVIAEAQDMSTYCGYGPEVTIQLAGDVWREKVLEIQRERQLQDTAGKVSRNIH